MNKYIIDLLKTESTVIIPEFGALMVTGKSLIFNPILKFNDGKLIKYIAETENRDEVEVGNMVAKHVRDITADIGMGNTYSVFGLGSFYKNEEGKIVFEAEGEQTKSDDKVAPVVKKVKKDPTPVVPPQKITEENKETSAKDVKPVIQATPTPEVSKAKPTPIINKVEEVKAVPLKEPEVIKVKEKSESKPKKKSKKGLVVLLLLLLILGGAGAFTAIKWDMVKGWFGNKPTIAIIDGNDNTVNDNELNSAEQDDEMLLTDSSIIDSDSLDLVDDTLENMEEVIDDNVTVQDQIEIQDEDVEVLPKVEPEVSNDLKYHISVGAFSSRENAEALVEKMRANGLPNARILPGSASLSKVVAGSYATRDEAKADVEKAQEYNSEAYVIKKTLR